MFLGSQSQYQTVDPEKVKVAEIQYDAQAMTFNNVMSTCNKKCIGEEFAEGDLNTGEQSCVDRCVKKFFTVNRLIGQEVQYNTRFNINKMPEYEKVKSYMNSSAQ